jgi:OOP family OmpA-OmpF porin
MRCDGKTLLVMLAGALAGCAAPIGNRVCYPVDSWASPVFHCEAVVAPPPVVVKPPPAEPPKKAEIKAEQIELKETIEFEIDSTNLVAKSTPVLDDVVEIMKDHPEILKIEVQGHTDSQGARPHNLKLSTGRAATVRNYLIDHGIDQGRIVSQGYGPDKPISDNNTAAGQAKNRRVEIHILERK